MGVGACIKTDSSFECPKDQAPQSIEKSGGVKKVGEGLN